MAGLAAAHTRPATTPRTTPRGVRSPALGTVPGGDCLGSLGSTDRPVDGREEAHEHQGPAEDGDDVHPDLRVADAPHVDETVGVLVDQSAARERVGNPHGRDQQCAAQCPPRDAAARTRERDDSDEGDRHDNVLEGVSDQREARQGLRGGDKNRVDDRGHGDHHERAQVGGPPPASDAPAAGQHCGDERDHDVGELGEIGQALDEALGSTRPAVCGTPEESLLVVGGRRVPAKGADDDHRGDARPGEGGDRRVGGSATPGKGWGDSAGHPPHCSGCSRVPAEAVTPSRRALAGRRSPAGGAEGNRRGPGPGTAERRSRARPPDTTVLRVRRRSATARA